MNKPLGVSTSAPLPFDQLSGRDFERLCFELVSLEGYANVEQPGWSGNDEGIDIIGYWNAGDIEELWYFQCKRYQKLSPSVLNRDVEKYKHLAGLDPKSRPVGVVFVTNCSLSQSLRRQVRDACKLIGLRCEFWAHTELDFRVKKHSRLVNDFFYSYRTLIEDNLPPGIRDCASVTNDFKIVLPNETLSFKTAERAGRLLERAAVQQVLSDLHENGHALVVGPAGSGKSVVAFQAALKFETYAEVTGLQIYYSTAPDFHPGETIDFLETKAPSLFIIDDAHEDEENASFLLDEWLRRREQSSSQTVFLLFLSQPFYAEEDDYQRTNLFHRHATTIKTLPDEDEFGTIVGHLWAGTRSERISQDFLKRIRRYTASSPALAALALGAFSTSISTGVDEAGFRKRLLAAIRRQYSVAETDQDGYRACLFSYYNIPIRKSSFGEEQVARLSRQGFLVPSPASKQDVIVFSRGVGELWHREHKRPDSWLAEVFEDYLNHDDSNYHQVLSGVHKSGHHGLLLEVVNNAFSVLQDRISKETDLNRAILALECISSCRRRTARLFIEKSLETRRLRDRIRDATDVSTLGRYLNVLTYHCRWLFTSSVNEDVIEDLAEILGNEATPLANVAYVSGAVARSNKERGQYLVRNALQGRGDPTQDLGAQRPVENALLFSGSISWFDRRDARRVFGRLTSENLTSLVLGAQGAKKARFIVESIESLDHRKAIVALYDVLDAPSFPDFAANLIQRPVNLYEISRLIREVRYVSYRLGHRFTSYLLPYLEQAIQTDKRLAAIGYLLNTLRRTNHRVARIILAKLKDDLRLDDLLTSEIESARFGKTLTAISSIDRVYTGDYIQGMPDAQLSTIFERARNLAGAAILLRALTVAAYNPDSGVDRILNIRAVTAKLEQLSEDNYLTQDLTVYADVISTGAPLSHQSKEKLLKYISPANFERAIRDEDDPRKAGQALRAYAATFPIPAYSFAQNLAKNDIVLNGWIATDDIAGNAFLLHSACEVDGRLSDALGRLIRPGHIQQLLQLEPKATRVAEYLHAISLVAPLKAQLLTRELYGKEDPVEIIKDSGDLRGTVKVLTAIRVAYSSLYTDRFKEVCKNKASFNSLAVELRSRCIEESNLGVLAILISLVKVFDRSLARQLITELDPDWVTEVARDNQITQVLEFVAAIAPYSLDVSEHSATRNSPAHLVDLLLTNTLPRLAELRSVRAFTTCITQLFRVGACLDSPEVELRGWEGINTDVVIRSLESSNDLVGCALISFLMLRLRESPSALAVLECATAKVLAEAGQHPLMPALFSLALVGAEASDVRLLGLLQKLREIREAKTWEIGFANWLRMQRTYAEKKHIPYPWLAQNVFDVEDHREVLMIIENEEKRAGSNLRFAFVLALASQLRIQHLPYSEKLVHDLYLDGASRSRLESRYWVRSLIDEFTHQVSEGESPLEERPPVLVSNAVRELSPRLEAVAGIGDQQNLIDPILGTQSSDLAT